VKILRRLMDVLDLVNPISILRATRRRLLESQQAADNALEHAAEMWAFFDIPQHNISKVRKAEDNLDAAQHAQDVADMTLDQIREVSEDMEDMFTGFQELLHSLAGDCPILPSGHNFDVAISTRPKYIGRWMAKVSTHPS
jgi:hypothetical protein